MTSKTQQVINHIQDNIHWQIYKKGERIPAVRELAKTLNNGFFQCFAQC